ncbi:MAG: hypothetical protein AAFY99_05370 [Pseudomonadota bacterium]
MGFLTYLWTRQRWPFLAFIVGFAALMWFGGHFVANFLYFNDPAHRNQTLEAWMTPRYVSLSYAVPPERLFPVLGLDPEGPHRKVRLGEIALEQGVTLEELQARVLAAKAAHEAAKELRERLEEWEDRVDELDND